MTAAARSLELLRALNHARVHDPEMAALLDNDLHEIDLRGGYSRNFDGTDGEVLQHGQDVASGWRRS